MITESKKFYRALLLGLSTMSMTGCASMQSPGNWFNREAAASRDGTSGFASTLSKTGKGIGGQFKTMGTAVSSAVEKTKSAVTSTFNSDISSNDDPTSLANMPTNLGPEIWVTNGQVYESQNNFAKAMDNYTKAVELDPSNEAALLSTARLYARQEQHAQSTDFFKKALAVAPNASTYNELALALQNSGSPAEAQAAVREAIELDGQNLRYRNNLAGMLVTAGRSDEAVKELEQIFPPAIANYNVAYLQVQNKNPAAAQQHLQAALKIDPNMALARDLMAQVTNNPAAQTAVAAYNTGESIYRTAQGIASPTVQADSAIYQMQPGGTTATPNGYVMPTMPTSNATLGIPSMPIATGANPGMIAPTYQMPAYGGQSVGPAIPTVK